MSKEKKAITEYIQKKHNDKIIVEITPTQSWRFWELFEKDNLGKLLINDDMKGVFEQETIWRRRSEYIRSNLHFLIIHDVDKIINFLKTAKRLKKYNDRRWNRKRKLSESLEEYESDVSRVFYNSIKSIIRKIKRESK